MGPLPWGKGRKKTPKTPSHEASSSSGGPALGGRPPGLCLPTPREADIIELAPKEELVTKNRRRREKEPSPRITDGEYRSVGRALDIWERLENPGGYPDVADDIFYEEGAMRYAKQGRIFCMEARRTKNFTYANRASREDWRRKVYFGEVPDAYTPEEEFFDLLARHRQSQYDATVKRKKKKR